VRVLLAPIVLAAIVVLIGGFGLILAALFVFFRDLQHLWGVVSFVFWMTSPVFYPAALVPEKIRPWFDVNPVGLAIGVLRNVALERVQLDVRLLATFLCVAAGFGILGHLAFRFRCNHFVDLL
jgi:ABC-type polysaccharide/polyol phosphate export permease